VGGNWGVSMGRSLKLGVALVMALGMWYYIHAVLIPYQRQQAATHKAPASRNLGDLFPRWLGARELLLHGRDPYGPEVTREIQIAAYGQVLDGTQHSLAKDEQRFAYPAYVVFLLAPTIDLPFPLVRGAFRLLLIALTGASVPLWLHALRLKMPRHTVAIIMLLVVGSYPVIQGLYLEQLTLLVCFLIAASCAALASEMYVPAGILLALATIKPQLTVAVATWFAVWAIGDWKRRKQLVWAFALTMAALCLAAEWVLPGWVGLWWRAMHAYLGYNDPRSLLEVLMGRTGGRVFSVLIGLGVTLSCWRMRRASIGSDASNAGLLLVIAAGLLIKPKFPLYDTAILLPAMLVLWACRRTLWERGLAARLLVSAAVLLVAWQWFWGLALVAVSFLSSSIAQDLWKLPPAALFLLPLDVALLTGLLTLNLRLRRTLASSHATA